MIRAVVERAGANADKSDEEQCDDDDDNNAGSGSGGDDDSSSDEISEDAASSLDDSSSTKKKKIAKKKQKRAQKNSMKEKHDKRKASPPPARYDKGGRLDADATLASLGIVPLQDATATGAAGSINKKKKSREASDDDDRPTKHKDKLPQSRGTSSSRAQSTLDSFCAGMGVKDGKSTSPASVQPSVKEGAKVPRDDKKSRERKRKGGKKSSRIKTKRSKHFTTPADKVRKARQSDESSLAASASGSDDEDSDDISCDAAMGAGVGHADVSERAMVPYGASPAGSGAEASYTSWCAKVQVGEGPPPVRGHDGSRGGAVRGGVRATS